MTHLAAHYDAVIVGAGIVGLATAHRLLARDQAAAEQLVRRWVGAAARYAKA